MLESYFPLLVKLAALASLASVLARSNSFKNLLMGETRTLNQRVSLSLWLSSAFGVSVAIRVFSKSYPAADLGLEGSLIAGILGGYVTGLASGVLISYAVFCLKKTKSNMSPGVLSEIPHTRYEIPMQ